MKLEESPFEDEVNRLDVEWLTYNAIREGVALSLGDIGLTNHRDTLRLAQRIAPTLFASSESLLLKKWESPESKEVRDVATAQGITFEAALDSEIQRLETLIQGNKNKKDSLQSLNRRLDRLKSIKTETTLRSYYEGKLIERDAKHGGNNSTPLENEFDGYYDFTLTSGRLMRIRVAHETQIEAINGADLMYEHHLCEKKLVKIAAVQYKILTDGKYVDKSKKLKSQLDRLKNCFCDNLPCHSEETNKFGHFYKLPECTAFLRPTYRLQNPKSTVLSRGFYLPVCLVNKIWDTKPIKEESVDGQVVRHAMFEDLFNAGLLGSRWLTIEQLDQVYKSHKVLEASETSVVHVKMYDL